LRAGAGRRRGARSGGGVGGVLVVVLVGGFVGGFGGGGGGGGRLTRGAADDKIRIFLKNVNLVCKFRSCGTLRRVSFRFEQS